MGSYDFLGMFGQPKEDLELFGKPSLVHSRFMTMRNGYLTWKKASKGRSTSRCARKPVARCLKVGEKLNSKDPKKSGHANF